MGTTISRSYGPLVNNIILQTKNMVSQFISILISICCISTTCAFKSTTHTSHSRCITTITSRQHTNLYDAATDVEDYLATNYPSCSNLFAKNGDAMKKIIKSDVGFTIFAPNEKAFKDLGKKRDQLEDVRNDEVAEKIASYHVILEPVTADQLFNSGGVVTEGGEVPAERSVSGGFLGVGGKG